jgi:outer membrane protein
MKFTVLAAALIAAAPLTAVAGSLATTPADTQVAPAAVLVKAPKLAFTLRAGVSGAPAYFGAKDITAGPDFNFSLDYLALPGGRSIGNADPSATSYGFAPRGSFRYIAKRSSKDHSELNGLNDVKAAAEIGLGLGYTQRNFEAFADVRYGAIGHHAWVGEVGANAVLHPSQQLTLRVGPRAFFGSSRYTNTYFGVTAAEAAALGSKFTTQYAAKGGLVSAGIELGVTYAINDTWGVEGAVRWDKYMGDAKNSPIVAQGKDNNVSLNIGMTRRFSF